MISILSSSCTAKIPARFVLATMIFTACFCNYMLRVNMSINLIAMVQPTTNSVSGKLHVPECSVANNETANNHVNMSVPDFGPRYNWDQKTQGLILGSYFWGYMVMAIPGGLFAEKWGPRRTVGIVGILSAILTILTPLSASLHYGVVVGIRFLLGFINGVTFPSMHFLMSRWIPPDEKGKFSTVLLGGNVGTVVTWPFLAAIIQYLGWYWAFYLPGILMLLWVITWYVLVYDTPDNHPRIKEEEKKYIEMNLGASLSKEKHLPPYLEILQSPAFYALLFLHFGSCWGLSLMVTNGPKYLAEVLGLQISGAGGLAALPHLSRFIAAFGFGAMADIIRQKKWMTVTMLRKVFVIFSHIIPGILLIIQPQTGCDIVLAVLLITLSLGMNGASTITNLQNGQDLAPNFAGSLYGMINCIGTTTGFINPILAGYITQENNGLAEWKIVFTIGAVVYIASGLVYFVFGSGEIQPWNYTETTEDKKVDQGQENNAFEQENIEKTIINNTISENTKV